MNKGILFGIISVVILGLIFGLSKSASYSDESASQNSALTAFRECVQNSEAAFYGAFWCSHCRYQKTLLGVEKDSQMPFYVECSTPDGNSQTAECIEKAIQSDVWISSRSNGSSSFQIYNEPMVSSTHVTSNGGNCWSSFVV